MTVICEFTMGQLEVIENAVGQALCHETGSHKDVLTDAWNAIRYQRAYGRLKKAPHADGQARDASGKF